MKTIPIITIILFVLVIISSVSAAGNTIQATSKEEAAALVYVSGYDMEPAVFYPYESGTITVHVTNTANASVVLSEPSLIEPHLKILSEKAFNTKTTIGPGQTVSYIFVVEANAMDGKYYPLFSIAPVINTYPIHATLTLKVDSTDVRVSISKKPDTFSVSKKDTVNVSIINPRDAGVDNVLIVPESDGAEVFPQESYLGTLAAGQSVQVPFSITPAKETNVTFHVSFLSGDTKHTTEVVLPVALKKDKMGAEIVVNNIESASSGMTTTLKGDVTNNGLTDAKSILVTVGDPARPVNPNPVYAVGNLEPDDFSSFEITYVYAGNKSVPLIVDYKDEEGNTFRETFSIAASDSMAIPGAGSLSAQSGTGSTMQRRGMFGSFGSGFGQIPVTEIVIILVAIALLVYAWRKGYLRSLRNRFRKDPLPGGKDDDDEPLEK
jgi:NADH:ubiquinone oxidoreductase subunit 3 (subunit A)